MPWEAISKIVGQYQTLIAAALGLAGAGYIGPKIASKYAREREIWSRRLSLANDLLVWSSNLRGLPDAPRSLAWDDINKDENPELEAYLDEFVQYRAKAETLYEPDSLGFTLVRLIKFFVFAPRDARVQAVAKVALYLQREVRGEARADQVGLLISLLTGIVSIMDRVPNERGFQSVVGKEGARDLTRELGDTIVWTLRRWAIIRPWTWKKWFQFELQLKRTMEKMGEQEKPHEAQ